MNCAWPPARRRAGPPRAAGRMPRSPSQLPGPRPWRPPLALALLSANTSGASPAAVRLLAKIATTAARQPAPPVRDGQFWYIKSWVANQVCNGGSGTATASW